MMLWYTLLTTVLLAIFLPVLYNVISKSLYDSAKNALKADMAQVELAIDSNNGDSGPKDRHMSIPDDEIIVIVNKNGDLEYADERDDHLNEVAFSPNTIREFKFKGDNWLVYDKTAEKGRNSYNLRVCYSLEEVRETLAGVLIVVIAVLPVYFLITIFGGLFIAKRSMRPIDDIVKLTKTIDSDDLSHRITGIDSEDEVGELASNFNNMLATLENSFEKEKRFTSDASHELRTPVSVIMANTESLMADSHDAAADKPLSTILMETRRMETIISQLLTLTRGGEGKYQVNKENADLKTMVDAILDQLKPEADLKSIKLENHINCELPVKIDQTLITQMFLNLVENGIKHGKAGGYVAVDARYRDGSVFISVKDNGNGISEEDLPHIFERFYRSDKVRDRSGTGLGLSIVKWIVDEHEGTIEVLSQTGQGTDFLISLKI